MAGNMIKCRFCTTTFSEQKNCNSSTPKYAPVEMTALNYEELPPIPDCNQPVKSWLQQIEKWKALAETYEVLVSQVTNK